MWNKTIIKFFQKIGFVFTNVDPCILAYKQGDIFILVRVYIDDLLLGSQSEDRLEWLKDWFMKEFNMKDQGKAKTIMGWEITRDFHAETLKINQKSYICNVLEAEEMSLCHPTVFPMKAGSTLFLDQAGDHIQADLTIYQQLIGKLMYLACRTRPDIAFIDGQLSRHNSDPRVRHLRIAKQVLTYLKETITLNIIWGNDIAGHW